MRAEVVAVAPEFVEVAPHLLDFQRSLGDLSIALSRELGRHNRALAKSFEFALETLDITLQIREEPFVQSTKAKLREALLREIFE